MPAPRPSARASARPGKALVPVGANCPHGHGPLTAMTAYQPALFRHGGYGETKRHTWRYCLVAECGYGYQAAVDAVRPERRRTSSREAAEAA